MAKTKKLRAFPKLHLFNRQRELPLKLSQVQAALFSLFSFLQISHQEVSIYFVSEKKISSLHKTFFDDPTPTDCISFPIDQEHLGEVFISPKAALLFNSKKPYEECLLYLVHGLLHLLGYDDIDPKERKTMRKMEKKCMAYLKKEGISLDPSAS